MNPKDFKKGQKVILKASNAIPQYVGKIGDVYSVAATYVYVTFEGLSSNVAIYTQDELCLADRKEQAKFLREKNVKLEEEVAKNNEEIKILEEFETEEAFVAHKLTLLMSAKSEKKMAEILKTLKESHYL